MIIKFDARGRALPPLAPPVPFEACAHEFTAPFRFVPGCGLFRSPGSPLEFCRSCGAARAAWSCWIPVGLLFDGEPALDRQMTFFFVRLWFKSYD
jgi:hypothetical protein